VCFCRGNGFTRCHGCGSWDGPQGRWSAETRVETAFRLPRAARCRSQVSGVGGGGPRDFRVSEPCTHGIRAGNSRPRTAPRTKGLATLGTARAERWAPTTEKLDGAHERRSGALSTNSRQRESTFTCVFCWEERRATAHRPIAAAAARAGTGNSGTYVWVAKEGGCTHRALVAAWGASTGAPAGRYP